MEWRLCIQRQSEPSLEKSLKDTKAKRDYIRSLNYLLAETPLNLRSEKGSDRTNLMAVRKAETKKTATAKVIS